MDTENPPCPPGLRIIRTARTEEEINRAAQEGFRPLIKPVTPGRNIHDMFALFQNDATGEVFISGDCRWEPPPPFRKIIDYTTYYPYHFPSPYAAYLVPGDLAPGTHVWLEDLIEDVVAVWGNQGCNPRLGAAEAIWNGSEFDVLFDSTKDAPYLIG